MFQMAICEDNLEQAGYYEQTFFNYTKERYPQPTIDIFSSGEEMFRHIRSGNKYDIILLDIEMNELDGIQLASLIRNQLHDDLAIIVFITAHNELIEKMFDAQPQHYLAKPVTEQQLNDLMQKMISLYQKRKKYYFIYSVDRVTHRFPTNKIIFFFVKNKMVYIKMTDGEAYFTGNLNWVMEHLEDENFVKVNRNYIVNYLHLSEISIREIRVSSGDMIALGANKYYEIFEKQAELRNSRK